MILVSQGARTSRIRYIVGGVISAGAVSICIGHIFRPELEVDTAAIALLVIAVLPWLGELLDSLELPGGWKVHFRQLQKELETARIQANGAEQAAQVAFGAVRAGVTGNESKAGRPEVEQLANEYEQIREMPLGPGRSAAMNRVFGQLCIITTRASQFNVDEALDSPRPGMRLAAYACLYTRPDPALLPKLVFTLTERENKNFSQYWAIRAVGVAISRSEQRVPKDVRARLDGFASRLDASSDRFMELVQILGSAPAA